jgi:tripartite-type tricarboxylate transporter receptor subunit TctC
MWGNTPGAVALVLANAAVLAQPAGKPAALSSAYSATYPHKAGRMVVAYPAGGPTDILARAVAQKLTASLGQQFVVDNRPGAAGIIGTELVARSPPDGYTLLTVPATHAVNPSIYAKMPFDTLRDLTHVNLIAEAPFILVVHPSLPVKNVRELAALARQRPGQLNYGATSLSGLPNLAGELFNQLNAVKLVGIPYKGGAPATVDLVAGHIQIMFNSMLASMPQVRGGRLRALGVTSLKRTPAAPEVPTIAEQGMPGFDVSGWYGVLAPAGLPADILARINAEVNRGMRDAAVIKRLAGEGVDAVTSTPDEFAARVKNEIEKWGKVVRQAGIKEQ